MRNRCFGYDGGLYAIDTGFLKKIHDKRMNGFCCHTPVPIAFIGTVAELTMLTVLSYPKISAAPVTLSG